METEKLQIDPSLFLTFNELEKKLWWEPLVSDENDDLYEEEEKNEEKKLEVCLIADFQEIF